MTLMPCAPHHRHRHLNQANAKAAKAIAAHPAPPGRPPIRLPLGTSVTRLTEHRKRTVTQYAQQAFRQGASGGTTFIVEFATQAGDVNYSESLERN